MDAVSQTRTVLNCHDATYSFSNRNSCNSCGNISQSISSGVGMCLWGSQAPDRGNIFKAWEIVLVTNL